MISCPTKGGGCKALLAAAQGSSLLAWPTGNCWLQFTVHSSSHLLSKGVAVLPVPIFRWEDQRVLIHRNALYSSPVNQRPLYSFFYFLFFFCYFLFKVLIKNPNQNNQQPKKKSKKPSHTYFFRVCFLPAPLSHGWKPTARPQEVLTLPFSPPHQHL